MSNRKTLKSEFENADGQRQEVLDMARECAAQTVPSALPRLNLAKGAALERPWQGIGSYGVSNLVNKLLLTVAPIGVPMFQSTASARIRADAGTTPEMLAALEARLYLRDLLVRDQLEAIHIRTRFRSKLEQIVVTGNGLSMLTDEYELKVFRFDQFVQRRGSGGQWLWVITHEKVDPQELEDWQLAKAELTREEMDKREANAEGLGLYTKCTRARNGTTVICQELNGKEISRSEEPVSRYFPAGYIELLSEHYSRGFVEQYIGPLRSKDGLDHAILDAAIAMAMMHPVVDDRGDLTPADLAKPSGIVLVGRVVGGVVDTVGVVECNKSKDMGVPFQQSGRLGEELATQMLVETAVQPTGDRVTAYQVNRIARELEGATGGIYAHVAEELQAPLVKRLIWQMQKDNRLPPLDPVLEKEINIETLTGLEAMGRQRDMEKIQTLAQTLSAMPELMRFYKPEWINNVLVRGMGIDSTQALKSKEELDAEQAQAAEMQAKMQLAQQAIQSGGKVVENASKPQAVRQGA